jgi:Protein of unknown function with PCYCGC motif
MLPRFGANRRRAQFPTTSGQHSGTAIIRGKIVAIMGRKSSAKAQVRTPASPQPPQTPRSFPKLLVVALVVIAVAVGGLIYARARTQADAAQARAQTPAATAPAPDVPEVNKRPHPQKALPPIPAQSYPPPRPMDVVRAAYVFAAEHPEVLSYVPCFCGCERGGHRGNEDCFVSGRDENGDVTSWEPHGLDCAVCIDVATEARQMFTSGAGIRDIRAAVEQKYAGFHGGHTPTPKPE